MKKFESERNTAFSVILRFISRIHAEHLANVILGFISRIHAEQNLSRHYRACPDNLDPRVKPEDDNRRRMSFKPEDDKGLMVDSRVKPENDHKRSLIKGLDVVCQCAALLERRVQSSTRVRKAQAVTRQTNPIGRSMIEMLGVLAIIGVLSVGGIAGYSKAMMKFKINKTIEQMSMILANTRILYSSQGNYSGLYGSGTYIEGIKPIIGETDEFLSPFGGYNWLETGSSHNDMFHLTFSALPKEACMELATLNWGTEQSSGIVGLGIGIGFVSWVAFNNYDDCINSSTSEHIVENSTYEILYTACKTKLPISPATAANYCNICAEAGDCGITLFSK